MTSDVGPRLAAFPKAVLQKDAVYLDATLTPHRSLGPSGFRLLMLIAGGSMLAIGAIFMFAGAWPVLGFCGLEFLLLYLCFRMNYRAARAYEHLRLTESKLEITTCDARGKIKRHSFQPYWLQIGLNEPENGGGVVTLSSHGRHLGIGRFLTPDERREVADALQDALSSCHAASNPVTAG